MSSQTAARDRGYILNGPIWSKIPKFAFPIAATSILELLFNASDIAVVGNFTGDRGTLAVAAVGANSSLISLIVNLFVGIALGANVVIAHAIGENDFATVKKAVGTSVSVSLIGGALAAATGELIAAPVLRLLSVPEDVLPYALLYLRIYLIGLPFILLYNFEAAIFRSVGDTKVPLAALAFSGLLNVLLNIFFVTVLGMTVDCVALATVISNAVSAVILYIRLRRTDKPIGLTSSRLSIDMKTLAHIVAIGLPAGIQSAVFSFANVIIQSAINSLGTVVMAASSAAHNMEVITYNILTSFGQACTTFVSQNHGAGRLDRCKRTLALCLLEGLIVLIAATALILPFGKPLISVFDSDPLVIETGYIRLVAITSSHIFSLVYDVISGYLRGFGISLMPALLTTASICSVRLCWVYLVFPQNPTFETIMAVYPISLSLTALLMVVALIIRHPAARQARAREKQKAPCSEVLK